MFRYRAISCLSQEYAHPAKVIKIQNFRKIYVVLQNFRNQDSLSAGRKTIIKMKTRNTIAIISSVLAVILTATSCGDGLDPDFAYQRRFWNNHGSPATRQPSENAKRTLLIYSAGYNNLSSALRDDIDDICENYLPDNFGYSDNLLVFAHHSVSDYDYRTDNPPCLIRLFRNRDGKTVRDTVRTWPEETRAVDTETLTEVLEYVRKYFPASEYGMIFSSHSTGWLPPNFSLTTYSASSDDGTSSAGKPERSIGQDAYTKNEMDAMDFAAAIPFRLRYIIFDACLTGGIEIAYELKDKCGYLVFSSEEILADGMVYTNIISRLLDESPSNLIGVAEDYFDHYNSQSGQYRSALISVVDCGKLDPLANVCADIFDSHAGLLPEIQLSQVQSLNYQSRYFYDLRDILAQVSSDDEMAEVDAALDDCVLYKNHTEYFINHKIDTYCGLSMYLPNSVSGSIQEYLNSYYKGFKWNQATGWISD